MRKTYTDAIKTKLSKEEFSRLAKEANERYISINEVIEEAIQKGGTD